MNGKPEAVYRRQDDVVAAEIDGELVMLNMQRGKYYGMTGIAPHLWTLLERPKTLSELVASVCDEYDVSEDVCLADVQSFLDEMQEFDLIKEHSRD